jgi:glutaredoxin-related protein
MRDMSPIKQEFSRRGVEFLAVNVFEEQAPWREFVAGTEIEMTWLWGGDEAVETYGVKGIPALVLLDEDQKVIWRSGLRTAVSGGRDIREALEAATGGPA